MYFIVHLLILLPAQIASYFSWAGPLIMRLIVGYTFMLAGWGKLTQSGAGDREFCRLGHSVSRKSSPPSCPASNVSAAPC